MKEMKHLTLKGLTQIAVAKQLAPQMTYHFK
jgi:hypothetical protein